MVANIKIISALWVQGAKEAVKITFFDFPINDNVKRGKNEGFSVMTDT